MSKNCVLYTVIDFEGLKNFYSEVSNNNVYDADSFFNLICDDAPFVGPTNQVLLLEPDITYTWQMNELSSLLPDEKTILPVITYFEFQWIGAEPVNWEGVFDVANSGFTIQGAKLICEDFDKASASIRTKKKLLDNVPNLRLSYSILFQFELDGKMVTGSIDPIIRNRTGEG